MVTVSAAVDVAREGQEPVTEWIGLVGFGTAADALLRCCKGDVVTAVGQLTRSTFAGRDGEERSNWSLRIEQLLSARDQPPRPRRSPRPNARRSVRASEPVYCLTAGNRPFKLHGWHIMPDDEARLGSPSRPGAAQRGPAMSTVMVTAVNTSTKASTTKVSGAGEKKYTVTILRAHGRRLAKAIHADGSFDDFDKAKTFDLFEAPVSGINDLLHILQKLDHRRDCCVVRGAIADPTRVTAVRRLLYRDIETGDEPSLRDAPQHWVALDFDSLPRPDWIDPNDLIGVPALRSRPFRLNSGALGLSYKRPAATV